eukprot:TRINITY_DN19003_c0_g1_i4.p3 TRINITY_DN19003_c0_g1~~TRINITY_DN19003_c0_g1_i4.p3  ORF type:complete len:129 (+),score=4.66 TRINITY_DN19003_c0_g1_i4:655-1041(+)
MAMLTKKPITQIRELICPLTTNRYFNTNIQQFTPGEYYCIYFTKLKISELSILKNSNQKSFRTQVELESSSNKQKEFQNSVALVQLLELVASTFYKFSVYRIWYQIVFDIASLARTHSCSSQNSICQK